MKKVFSILSLLIFLQIQVYSQSKTSTLSGVILDNDTKEKVEYASVRILNAKDSTLIKGVSTNQNGQFSLIVDPGSYVIKVSFLGYKDYIQGVNLSNSTNLGNISLLADATMLAEAVVEAKAIEIMVKGDTIEYNADSYKVQESAVVEDLLKKMPGVEIDENGKITVNGKEVKKIMLDGKEFFSDDPKVASKNLPAKMVEKLQVLDRKSDMSLMTGFDDGNEETVINLTIKPGMKEGVFGNALAGVGNKDRYEGNGMVNYLRNSTQISVLGGVNNTNNAGMSDLSSAMFESSGGSGPRGLRFGGNNGVTKSITGGFNFATEYSDKLKWGGDIRYGNNDNDVITHSNKTFTSDINPGTEVTDSWGNNKTQSFATNLKFEWTPDKLTKIVFRPRVEYNTNDTYQTSNSIVNYDDVPGSELVHLNSTSDQRYTSNGSGYKLNGDLDMSRKLNDKGRVLSIGLKGGYSKSDSDGLDYNYIDYVSAAKNDSIIDQNFFQDDKSYNWRAFTSYVEPLGRNNFLELSYNISNNNSTTDKQSYSNKYLSDPNMEAEYSVIDTTNTRYIQNDFINQNISLKFRSQREKFNYTIGLGLEPSSSKTILREPNKDELNMPRKNYLSFAPSGQFNYFWDSRHNIRVDYRGTTNEPTTLQLYDGVYSRSGLNTTSGNPELRPSFQNTVSINYRKFVPEKASFMALMGRFNHVSNAIVSTQITNKETGGRETTYDNVSGNMGGNLRFIFNTPLRNRNWSVNSMSYASYDINNTLIDAQKNKAKTLALHENLGLQFKSSIIDFALRGNVRYTNMKNSITTNNNKNTVDYGGTYDFTFYVPNPLKGVTFFEHILSDLTIQSDINYSTNSGYGAGFEKKEWLWNASIAKQVFKNKAGTIRFKMYDILKERSNISRTYNPSYIEDSMSNSISSYFMVHFVYRFQIFKGGAKMDDMSGGGRRGMGGGGRPH